MKVARSESNAPLPGSVETDPAIPAEAHPAENGSNVRAIVPIEVPEERTGSYSPEGQDTDFSNQVRPEIRKPEPFEKFIICIRWIMETILLITRVGAKGYTSQHYYVEPALRPEIGQGLKAVVVIPWWSFRDRRWYLWIVNASEDSSYYANLKPFLEQDEEFYRGASFTVETDKDSACYKIKKFAETRKFPGDPGRKTGVMLGQALGSRGVIRTTNHPVFAELAAGEEINL